MDKTKYINYLNGFLIEEEPLLRELQEGYLNKDDFHNYTKTIYELSRLSLTEAEKRKCIISIWQINHYIQNFLISHFDNRDVYKIENLGDDDRRQLMNILMCAAIWFSYDKEINLNDLIIGTWK